MKNNSTPFRKTKLGKYIKKAKNRVFRYRKKLYLLAFYFKKADKRHVFIFGCQRSGTTLLGQVFAKDLRTAVLQERSCITSDVNDILRLKPLLEVIENLKKFQEPLIIAKPLVESHNADQILAKIPNAQGLWMFRNYKDVIASNVKRFSTQVEGMRMAISGTPPSWRSEMVNGKILALFKRFYHPDMKKADAAALGWCAINTKFFELELDKNPKLRLVNYDDFVINPEMQVKRIYRFLNIPYPGRVITGEVDKHSVSLGKEVKIDPQIEILCKNLYERILNTYQKQNIS